ncbi:thiamine pyrophosphate-binding protein [bacterium]|nr:thiamine pyrophosphate-binding protein [bacterium]
MTVAAYIAEFLKEKKVDKVFGYQGSAMLKLLDEMLKLGNVQYIQAFHEQAAAFEADAYARISGKIGVAIGTSGPGAVNLIAGVADAYYDSVPMVFLTGQYYSNYVLKNNGARQNGFQDMDIVSMVKPITKNAVMITKTCDVKYELEKAFWVAQNGRKGPTLIDIPMDVQFAEYNEEEQRSYLTESEDKISSKEQYEELACLIKESARPIILVGGGVRQAGAEYELEEFVKRIDCPVVSTLHGIDAYKDLYGFAGLHGATHANIAVQKADLIISLGCRFSINHAGKNPKLYTNAKIVQVDVDEHELNRVFPMAITVQADLKQFLGEFNKYNLQEYPKYSVWKHELEILKGQLESRVKVNKNPDPIDVVQRIITMFDKKVITADVGQNQMWVAQALHLNGKDRFISSGGYGSMGFSLPAAIGASIAKPEITVLSFMSDGGFHMNQQELLYLQLSQANVKCVVFNNSCLGLMRDTQKRYYDSHFWGNTQDVFRCVNLERLANTYDLRYILIEKIEDIDGIKEKLSKQGPCLIEVKLDNDSTVINRYDEFMEMKDQYGLIV